eukprot:CAMPEP_0119322442 /NCGR_PEP_ID=MMETSP1333-20130426/58202_1 /TAXON_ID=418940 /ORGANISM="Scyphosphaera apsteinii, Strain RCC1455" /LENGTH=173 /DNA_ID=CAMNT_0007329677 /DNA_START=351 /DNA_END=872 /DNA_ORIENTATION=-
MTHFVPLQPPSMPHFAPPTAPRAPTSPYGSCYVFLQSCNQNVRRNMWTRDYWGEENQRAGSDRAACEQIRRSSFASWCGISVNAVATHFNPPQFVPTGTVTPSSPERSCYFIVINCIQAGVQSNVWTRDHWGEINLNSGSDRFVCLQSRRNDIAAWCSTSIQAVTMQFIPPLR